MTDDRQPTGRLVASGFCAAAFAIALAALVTSQLALMSVFDTARAERAAEQIAESRFTADLIEQTVVRAVGPVAGDQLAQAAADAASSDADVTRVVEVVLVDAHRQVVDPDAPSDPADGNLAVGTAIVSSIVDTAADNGVDLAALGVTGDPGSFDPSVIARQAGLPEVVPEDLPRLGLRQIAETTRLVALVALVVFAVLAVAIHPRPGRSLRGLGLKIAIVTGVWLIALVIGGWVIGRMSDTLFGEMIDAVWSDAVPAMLLLVGAGVVIGTGLVFAGMALDAYHRDLRRRDEQRRQEWEHYQRSVGGR